MQAPARCACWLRSGPGPLAAQDRPPQSPPPHRTALLCSSSSGPDAASREGRRDGGQTWEQRQGVETMTQNVAAWSHQQGGRRQTYARQSRRCGVRSVARGATDATHAGICPRSHSEHNFEGCHKIWPRHPPVSSIMRSLSGINGAFDGGGEGLLRFKQAFTSPIS